MACFQRRILLTAIFMSVMPAFGHAAVLSPIKGEVLVNMGNGYMPIVNAVEVKPGDLVFVSPEGQALIDYGSGCLQTVLPRTVVWVEPQPPCQAAPQRPAETIAGSSPAGTGSNSMLVGTAIVAGGAAAALALAGGGDKTPAPASP